MFDRFLCLGMAWAVLLLPTLAWPQDQGTPATQGSQAKVVADPQFDILEFEVHGNSVLDVETIERVVTPFLGLNKTMADVEAARAALEKVYQSVGYLTVFVDVPEQRVDGGVVMLNVIEGRIELLRVTASRY